MDSVPQKQCVVCKQFFPPTTEYFYVHKRMRTGIHNECKACSNARRKKSLANKIAIPPPEGALKKCPKCGIDKPATSEYFHSCRSRPDGLSTPCKKCKGIKKYPIDDVHRGMRRCTMCEEWKPATLD